MASPSSSDGYARSIELTERAMQCSDETHYEEGELLLREAMHLVSDEGPFTENYVQFCLQVAHNNTLSKDYPEAIIYFHKALTCTPDDAEVLMDLGAAYAHNDEAIEALGAWQKALALLKATKIRDKENIATILENVRTVQKALKETEID